MPKLQLALNYTVNKNNIPDQEIAKIEKKTIIDSNYFSMNKCQS